MKKSEIDDALAALWTLVKETQPIIIGSQALHGKFPDVADTICFSREVDVMLPNKLWMSKWIFEVVGEGTPFDVDRGFYIDHVIAQPGLPILADGWKERAIRHEFVFDGKVQGSVLYLSPEDMAISKLGAGRPKDIGFVSALLQQGYITLPDLQELVSQVAEPAYRSKVQATLSMVEPEHRQLVSDLASQWKATPGKQRETGRVVALSETEIIQDAGRGRLVAWRRLQPQKDGLVVGLIVTAHLSGRIEPENIFKDGGGR